MSRKGHFNTAATDFLVTFYLLDHELQSYHVGTDLNIYKNGQRLISMIKVFQRYNLLFPAKFYTIITLGKLQNQLWTNKSILFTQESKLATLGNRRKKVFIPLKTIGVTSSNHRDAGFTSKNNPRYVKF